MVIYCSSCYIGNVMGDNTKDELNFYKVDKAYVDYLRGGEIAERGKSCVPLLNYIPPQKEKFMCGILLHIGCFDYIAPVSSYTIQQKNNVLLYDKDKNVTSSVRLNYMLPVLPQYYSQYNFNTEVDSKYRGVVQRERESANEQREVIRKVAKQTYQIVKRLKAQGKDFNWASDFELLERLAIKYKT